GRQLEKPIDTIPAASSACSTAIASSSTVASRNTQRPKVTRRSDNCTCAASILPPVTDLSYDSCLAARRPTSEALSYLFQRALAPQDGARPAPRLHLVFRLRPSAARQGRGQAASRFNRVAEDLSSQTHGDPIILDLVFAAELVGQFFPGRGNIVSALLCG